MRASWVSSSESPSAEPTGLAAPTPAPLAPDRARPVVLQRSGPDGSHAEGIHGPIARERWRLLYCAPSTLATTSWTFAQRTHTLSRVIRAICRRASAFDRSIREVDEPDVARVARDILREEREMMQRLEKPLSLLLAPPGAFPPGHPLPPIAP